MKNMAMTDQDWLDLGVPTGEVYNAGGGGWDSGAAITPGQMSAGATSWDGVLANGVSRLFDVAGKISLAKNLPYYQTAAGQQALQWQTASAATSRMLTMLLIGAAVILIVKKVA